MRAGSFCRMCVPRDVYNIDLHITFQDWTLRRTPVTHVRRGCGLSRAERPALCISAFPRVSYHGSTCRTDSGALSLLSPGLCFVCSRALGCKGEQEEGAQLRGHWESLLCGKGLIYVNFGEVQATSRSQGSLLPESQVITIFITLIHRLQEALIHIDRAW